MLIHDELDLPVHSTSVTFWTDSPTVLEYITNEKRRFKPFIANRVNRIHDASAPEPWQHVPASLNPADEGSRGMEIHSLKPNCSWLSGSKFLLQPEDQWPVREIGNIPDDDKEIQVGSHVTFISFESALDLLPKCYSSWPSLQTLMAWLLRFVEYIKNKNALPKRRGIGIVEIRNSTQKIGPLVQHLWKDHPISTLIVHYYHETSSHAGREHILCHTPEIWILQARSLIQRVLRKCVDCR